MQFLWSVLGIFVLCTAFVSALDTTNSPYPRIGALFSERVTLQTATLKDNASVTIPLTASNGTATIPLTDYLLLSQWYLDPSQFLLNRRHTLNITASDFFGNVGRYQYNFTVDAAAQAVWMEYPEHGGVTNFTDVDVIIRTEYSSVCRWSKSNTPAGSAQRYLALNYSFNRTAGQGTTHIIDNLFETLAITPAPDAPFNISVSCNMTNTFTPGIFPIVYQTEPPAFYVKNSPDPVIELDNSVTTITIDDPQQEIWCSLTDDSALYNTIFGERNTTTFAKQLQGDYIVSTAGTSNPVMVMLTCENRAGLITAVQYPIDTDYDALATITVKSARATKNSQYTLNFTTNRLANCTVELNGSAAPVSQAVLPLSTRFSSANRLSPGNNPFKIQCISPLQDTASVLDFNVVLDTEEPVITEIDALNPTCDLTRMRFTFNATDPDPGSGIAYYNYTIKQGTNVIVPWKTTNQSGVDERGLSLTNGTKYTITATAVDGAGNIGQAKSNSNITATSNRVAACDNVPPTTHLRTNSTAGQTKVWFSCDDGDAPCYDSVWFSANTSKNATCPQSGIPLVDTKLYTNKTTLNGSFVIRANATVCWAVADQAFNYAFGEKFVSVNITQAPLALCTDAVKNGEETDLDCGGKECAEKGKVCALGKVCIANRDCATNACKGGLCAQSTCSDNQKNGNESDIDCGGPQCPACGDTFSSCFTDSDCTGLDVCEDGVCVSDPSGTIDCDPAYGDCGSEEENPDGGMSLISIVLIALGSLLALGGVAVVLLHKGREPIQSQSFYTPPQSTDSIDQPLVMQQPEQPATDDSESRRSAAERRRERKRNKLRKALRAFDSGEDLAAAENVTHAELEAAYHSLDNQTFAETTKNLLEQDKVDKKDVAVALADAAAKPDADHEAIADLRRTFGLQEAPETEEPKSSEEDNTDTAKATSEKTVAEEQTEEKEDEKPPKSP